MYESDKMTRDEIKAIYEEDVHKLLRYLNWLQKVSGTVTSDIYKGEGIESTSVTFPVYDANLLAFIKEIKGSVFMNKNCVYTYSKYRLRTPADELKLIDRCTMQEVKLIGDILANYAIKGTVKGTVWSEGVKNGIYLAAVLKLKDLLEIRKPLA
ncbi:MAG: hypothetical protein E7290_05340 [Lachnospiraceae bacterium]|nr:hypothetical protein [Lachnospiraceae bacterium]